MRSHFLKQPLNGIQKYVYHHNRWSHSNGVLDFIIKIVNIPFGQAMLSIFCECFSLLLSGLTFIHKYKYGIEINYGFVHCVHSPYIYTYYEWYSHWIEIFITCDHWSRTIQIPYQIIHLLVPNYDNRKLNIYRSLYLWRLFDI